MSYSGFLPTACACRENRGGEGEGGGWEGGGRGKVKHFKT